MRTCLHVLAAGYIPTMSELINESGPSFERRPHNIKDDRVLSNVFFFDVLHVIGKYVWRR